MPKVKNGLRPLFRRRVSPISPLFGRWARCWNCRRPTGGLKFLEVRHDSLQALGVALPSFEDSIIPVELRLNAPEVLVRLIEVLPVSVDLLANQIGLR